MRALMLVALAAPAADAAAMRAYLAVPLGTLGGESSEALALNARGQVTGRAQLADGRWHAFLYTDGTMVDLDAADSGYSVGNAINSSGHVTGCMSRDATTHGFVNYGNGMEDIEALAVLRPPAGSFPTRLGCGVGIDDAGRVIGPQYWDFQYAVAPSYLYSSGAIVDIPQSAAALNERGDVVGTAASYNRAPEGWAMIAGETIRFGPQSAATAINQSSQVTGYTSGAVSTTAFLYDGSVRPLIRTTASASSRGLAINGVGDVVGQISDTTMGDRAFVYSQGDDHDLNALVSDGLDGATLTAATGVNDAGVIVANSCRAGPPFPPPCVAFKLVPLEDPESPANVPALSTLALVALALSLASTAILKFPR